MKLRPCPYCGTEPELLHIYDGEEVVRCPNEDGCPVNPHAAMNTIEDAKYLWNERMDNLDRIEKLKAKLRQQTAEELLGLVKEDEVLIKRLEEALAQIPRWQPIETAPKDGTRILVATKYGIEVAEWEERAPQWGVVPAWIGMGLSTYEEDRELTPTHWMPLPPPPETKP